MTIVDVLIIIFLLFGAFKGWKHGVFSSLISLVGTIAIIIISYYLKNPISVILYEHLPFFDFGGIFEGISSINILLYEGISFLFCLIILSAVLKILLKFTGVVDRLVKGTIILNLPSRLIGVVFGVLEYLLYSFVLLIVLSQFPKPLVLIKESDLAQKIMYDTPVISEMTSKATHAISEIYDIGIKYDKKGDKEQGDLEAVKVLMKYEIVTKDSVNKLVETGKLKIKDIESTILEEE